MAFVNLRAQRGVGAVRHRRRRGVGDLAADCSMGNATACTAYYKTQYTQAPSVIAAQSPTPNMAQAQAQAQIQTAPAAPPAYSYSGYTPSSDPAIFGTQQYAQSQLAQGAVDQTNAENARRYANYQVAYSNWLQNGSVGTPPPLPTYVTIQEWYAANPAAVPQSNIQVSQPAPMTVAQAEQIYNSAPPPATGTFSASIAAPVPPRVVAPAPSGPVPPTASGQASSGIPQWAYILGAGLLAVIVLPKVLR